VRWNSIPVEEARGVVPVEFRSGGVACAEPETAELLDRLQGAGTPGHVIGRFLRRSSGVQLARGSVRRDLPVFDADELTRLA